MVELDRFPLAEFPTPIEPLERLTDVVGGPRLWMKRDDLTGLGLGGNKIRKLELILPAVRAGGYDTLVTSGGIQSNHVRLTGAAARRANLRCEALVFPTPRGKTGGNLLLDRLLGIRMHRFPFPFAAAAADRVAAEVERVLEAIRRDGRKPYYIPPGGAEPLGVLGYSRAVEEIAVQERSLGIRLDRLVTAVGTGGTLAGLVLGSALHRRDWRITGFSVAPRGEMERIGVPPPTELVAAAASLSGTKVPSEQRIGVEIDYAQVGEGYGVPSEASKHALLTVADCEGIILDPVYTAKAMAGVLEAIRDGRFATDEEILFLHTGGVPALFAAGLAPAGRERGSGV